MSSGMTFCTQRRAKDDEILCDAGVDDEHHSHSAACVVPGPFRCIRDVGQERRVGSGDGKGERRVDRVGRMGQGEGSDDVGDDGRRVVRMEGDCFLGE